ncbi:c6 finger domain-containing [Fusarium longipes]|uniref:C6 finger domain-containing n=1 Tax=Fusarium longipes TaxID=694270 RepID=A0A395SUU2_9HYPO|nr:c6 finger domain-containing [Fusarium longipes]
MNGTQKQPRKRAPKLFHKKSRTGCQQCRSRRVKCNEAKPACSHCSRLQLSCIYDRAPSDSNSSSSASAGGGQQKKTTSETIVDPPESESRRKQELALFHQYITDTGPSLVMDPATAHFWVTTICRLALESDATLYAIYMVAALHTEERSNFSDPQALDTCQTYLNMAIREHHKDITEISSRNLEYICLTSSMLRVYGFARLQHRSLEPYTPPVDLLRITGTSTAIFREAWDLIQDNPESVVYKMIESASDLIQDNDRKELPEDLKLLLRREKSHELQEPWDAETEEAYLTALNLIGCIQKVMDENNIAKSIGRRTVVFPMMMRKKFADLVEELRPRALVILAYYFALLSMLSEFWWIGDSGVKEFEAIGEVLPHEWQGWLEWPRSILRNQNVVMEDKT